MTRTRLKDMGFDVMLSNLGLGGIGILRSREESEVVASGNDILAVWHISKRCAAASRFLTADSDLRAWRNESR